MEEDEEKRTVETIYGGRQIEISDNIAGCCALRYARNALVITFIAGRVRGQGDKRDVGIYGTRTMLCGTFDWDFALDPRRKGDSNGLQAFCIPFGLDKRDAVFGACVLL